MDRGHQYYFGKSIQTKELPRENFLARLHTDEKGALTTFLKRLSHRDFEESFPYGGLLAVGSSTYSDEYYSNLESFFLDNGLTRKDTIVERSFVSPGDAFLSTVYESKSYAHFKELASKVQHELMAASLHCSEDEYQNIKSQGQPEYTREVSIDDLLSRKGEDIDLLFALDDYHKQSFEQFSELKHNLSTLLDVPFERTQLSGHNYFLAGDGKVYRSKMIEGVDDTLSIKTPQRRIHLYVKSLPLQFHIDRASIENAPFSRLVRRGLYHECINEF